MYVWYIFCSGIAEKGNGVGVKASQNGAEQASQRLQKLHQSSAALRELLQKRAESQMQSVNGDGLANGDSLVPSKIRNSSAMVAASEVPARRMVKVTFWMKFHVDYGQHIVLVGSMPELGSWILADAVALTWSEGDLWHATLELPSTSVLEYKYVVVGQGGHAVAWQSGNNSVLAISDDEDEVEVHDNWGGNPGATVVSGDNLPVTREKKLLSWATDLENQVIQQRQELRKLRMELVAAQEEARLARDEAKKLRRELANAEAEKATTSKAIRNAEAVNTVLKDQIKDTTASFREALQTAVEILEADKKTNKSKAKSK